MDDGTKDLRLVQYLFYSGVAMVRGTTAADPTGAWPEEKSFLALGVGEDTARKLGNRFRQDAVVWVRSDAVPRLLLLR